MLANVVVVVDQEKVQQNKKNLDGEVRFIPILNSRDQEGIILAAHSGSPTGMSQSFFLMHLAVLIMVKVCATVAEGKKISRDTRRQGR